MTAVCYPDKRLRKPFETREPSACLTSISTAIVHCILLLHLFRAPSLSIALSGIFEADQLQPTEGVTHRTCDI